MWGFCGFLMVGMISHSIRNNAVSAETLIELPLDMLIIAGSIFSIWSLLSRRSLHGWTAVGIMAAPALLSALQIVRYFMLLSPRTNLASPSDQEWLILILLVVYILFLAHVAILIGWLVLASQDIPHAWRLCRKCGYDLQGLHDETRTCPECGYAIAYAQRQQLKQGGQTTYTS